MVDDPRESGNQKTQKTRATRWLIWSGGVSLALAGVNVVMTVLGMMLTIRSVGNSGSPKPSDLANGISMATLPSIFIVPLLILGVVLIIAGLVVRQPVDQM
jgi:hypothetical protein